MPVLEVWYGCFHPQPRLEDIKVPEIGPLHTINVDGTQICYTVLSDSEIGVLQIITGNGRLIRPHQEADVKIGIQGLLEKVIITYRPGVIKVVRL